MEECSVHKANLSQSSQNSPPPHIPPQNGPSQSVPTFPSKHKNPNSAKELRGDSHTRNSTHRSASEPPQNDKGEKKITRKESKSEKIPSKQFDSQTSNSKNPRHGSIRTLKIE